MSSLTRTEQPEWPRTVSRERQQGSWLACVEFSVQHIAPHVPSGVGVWMHADDELYFRLAS